MDSKAHVKAGGRLESMFCKFCKNFCGQGWVCALGLSLVLWLAACAPTNLDRSETSERDAESVSGLAVPVHATGGVSPSAPPPAKLRAAAEALAREDWYAAQDLSRATLQEAHAALAALVGKEADETTVEVREQAQLFLLYALILLGEVWHDRDDCSRATVPLTRAVLLWRAAQYSETTLVYADLLSRRASCAARLGDEEVRQGAGQDLAYALSLVRLAEEQGGEEAAQAAPIATRIAQGSLWLNAHNGAVAAVEEGLAGLLATHRQRADPQGLFTSLIFASELRLFLARAFLGGGEVALAERNYSQAAALLEEALELAETGLAQGWFVLVRLHRAALELRRVEKDGVRGVASHALTLAEIWRGYGAQAGLSEKSRQNALREQSAALQQAAAALASLGEAEAVRRLLQDAAQSLAAARTNERNEDQQLQGLRDLLRRTRGDDAALLQALAP